MPHSYNETLARAHHETAKHVAAARISNRDSHEHVRQSKEAIFRSLELLRVRFFRTFG